MSAQQGRSLDEDYEILFSTLSGLLDAHGELDDLKPYVQRLDQVLLKLKLWHEDVIRLRAETLDSIQEQPLHDVIRQHFATALETLQDISAPSEKRVRIRYAFFHHKQHNPVDVSTIT